MKQYNFTSGNALPIVIGAGLSIAVAIFLVTFITTQRAQTLHPRSNLVIPIPTPPPRPTLPPRKLLPQFIIIPTPLPAQISTESAEIEEALILETPPEATSSPESTPAS